jgi:hypothetical protein
MLNHWLQAMPAHQGFNSKQKDNESIEARELYDVGPHWASSSSSAFTDFGGATPLLRSKTVAFQYRLLFSFAFSPSMFFFVLTAVLPFTLARQFMDPT